VHEELRLQAETGVLLWLCLRQQEYRDRSREARLAVIDAIRRADAASARRATVEHIMSAVEWLVDEKARLEAASVPDAATTRPPSTEGSRP
jgi:DNA-binding GntR family transcriptional regulator